MNNVSNRVSENGMPRTNRKQKEEVIAMSIFEYDEEAVLDYIGQKQWEDGRAEGYESGKAEGALLQQVISVRKNILKGKSADAIAEFMDLDIEFVRRLADIIERQPLLADEALILKMQE